MDLVKQEILQEKREVIVILVKTIKEQRDFIENALGKEAKGAKKTMQMLMTIDGKHHDKIVYRLEDGSTEEFIFHLAQFPIGS